MGEQMDAFMCAFMGEFTVELKGEWMNGFIRECSTIEMLIKDYWYIDTYQVDRMDKRKNRLNLLKHAVN